MRTKQTLTTENMLSRSSSLCPYALWGSVVVSLLGVHRMTESEAWGGRLAWARKTSHGVITCATPLCAPSKSAWVALIILSSWFAAARSQLVD